MPFRIEQPGVAHECSQFWSEDASFQLSETKIKSIRNRVVVEREDGEKYTFAVLHPVSENISMPDAFLAGRWQKPRMWIVGRGGTVVEAEQSALRRMNEVSECNHKFRKADDTMSGNAVCMRCDVFVNELMLHPDIHAAKYGSLALHGDEEVEPGIKMKSHLLSMVTEMSFDPNLTESKKVDLLCAGWLHHAENTSSRPSVENILKNFHLCPSEMYESLVLGYYDTVDMLKSLLPTKNYKLLRKYLGVAKVVLEGMKSADLPHCGFLESYILMSEQIILSDASA